VARRSTGQQERLTMAGFQTPAQRDGCHNCRHAGSFRWYGRDAGKVAVRCTLHRADVSKHSICGLWER
jgi:hypothetical protein